MNKVLLSIVIVAVAAIGLATAGFVYAQSPTPPVPSIGNISGYGMMGGRGMGAGMMGYGSESADLDGPLHTGMLAAFAEKLGIAVEDLNTRLANGESMYQIAASKGLSMADFRTLMSEARSQAISKAVKDGTLTQAQADAMGQRGAGQMMNGARGGYRMGAGQGQSGNPNCPFFQANP